MKTLTLCCLAVAALAAVVSAQHPVPSSKLNSEEQALAKFLAKAEAEMQESTIRGTFIEWEYATNINDENERKKLAQQKLSDALYLRLGQQARKFDASNIHDKDLKRKLKMISDIGSSALPRQKLDRYNEITNEMQKIYSTAQVPDYRDKSIMHNYEPGLVEKLAHSRDPEELKYYWKGWRKATGDKMRDLYLEYIDLTNEYSRLNGYRDGTASKTQSYESETFVDEMADTWRGLKPLYQELHAYVRNKLVKQYGEDVVPKDGPIPAHLLGNMWAQSWNNLKDILKPYPNKPNIDVTDAMVKQGWTQKIMFEKAEEFFTSMGLPPMRDEFWEGSLIKKPDDGRDLRRIRGAPKSFT